MFLATYLKAAVRLLTTNDVLLPPRLYGLEVEQVLRRSTLPAVVRARSLVSLLAVEDLGYKGTEVGRILGISRSGTTKAVARGRALVSSGPTLRDQMLRKEQREIGK